MHFPSCLTLVFVRACVSVTRKGKGVNYALLCLAEFQILSSSELLRNFETQPCFFFLRSNFVVKSQWSWKVNFKTERKPFYNSFLFKVIELDSVANPNLRLLAQSEGGDCAPLFSIRGPVEDLYPSQRKSMPRKNFLFQGILIWWGVRNSWMTNPMLVFKCVVINLNKRSSVQIKIRSYANARACLCVRERELRFSFISSFSLDSFTYIIFFHLLIRVYVSF